MSFVRTNLHLWGKPLRWWSWWRTSDWRGSWVSAPSDWSAAQHGRCYGRHDPAPPPAWTGSLKDKHGRQRHSFEITVGQHNLHVVPQLNHKINTTQNKSLLFSCLQFPPYLSKYFNIPFFRFSKPSSNIYLCIYANSKLRPESSQADIWTLTFSLRGQIYQLLHRAAPLFMHLFICLFST